MFFRTDATKKICERRSKRDTARLSATLAVGKILLGIEFVLFAFWAATAPYIIVHDYAIATEDGDTFSGDHLTFAFHLATAITIALVLEHYKPHVRPISDAHRRNSGVSYRGPDEDPRADHALGVGYLASWALSLMGSIVTDVVGLTWIIRIGRFVESSPAYRIEVALNIWGLACTVFACMWSLWLLIVNLQRRFSRFGDAMA